MFASHRLHAKQRALSMLGLYSRKGNSLYQFSLKEFCFPFEISSLVGNFPAIGWKGPLEMRYSFCSGDKVFPFLSAGSHPIAELLSDSKVDALFRDSLSVSA